MIDSSGKPLVIKANALLCRSCCIEYVEIHFDLKINDLVLKDVKGLRCPSCNEEVFSPEQIRTINERTNNLQYS